MVKPIKHKPNILERRRQERTQGCLKVVPHQEQQTIRSEPVEFSETKNYAGMRHKYIRIRNYGFITWPMSDNITHAMMFDRMGIREGSVVSAGFVHFYEGKAHVSGYSESLGIGMHFSDEEAMNQQYGFI